MQYTYMHNVIYTKYFIKLYKCIADITYTVYMIWYSLILYKNLRRRKATIFVTAWAGSRSYFPSDALAVGSMTEARLWASQTLLLCPFCPGPQFKYHYLPHYLSVGVSSVFVLHGVIPRQPVTPAHLECHQVLHDGLQSLLFICDSQEFQE